MPSSCNALDPVASFDVGNAEQNERLHAKLAGGADLIDQPIDAELVVARHRRDLLPNARARPDEQRQNEVANVERRLADHVADERIGPQATRADDGEAGGLHDGRVKSVGEPS